MRLIVAATLVATMGAVPSILPAQAASFDCAKATSAFEKAICGSDTLSKADERLAKTYATATGGLSETALAEMRKGQREWLSFAQRACTRDAEPLASGAYDERGVDCLIDLFNGRSTTLESSRMLSGIRFYPASRYGAAPDPYEADDPDSYWPVSKQELSVVQIDGDEGFVVPFNELVREAAGFDAPQASSTVEADGGDDASSDSDNSIVVKEVAGIGRITLEMQTYWYGHGAAHGNWSLSYRHFLRDENRWIEASDLFAGKGWQKALLDLTVEALRAEHGDMLMLDDASYIADSVIDPTRWELSDPYGLVIQFQPYEVAAYAYGAPTARVSWDALTDYLAEGADKVRYGW